MNFPMNRELANKRWNICKKCPELKGSMLTATCRICGCVMAAKVQLKGAKCPIDNWLAEK